MYLPIEKLSKTSKDNDSKVNNLHVLSLLSVIWNIEYGFKNTYLVQNIISLPICEVLCFIYINIVINTKY